MTFKVDSEWRIQAPVDIQEPYLSEGELMQWVSNAVSRFFVVDFLHMDEQLANLKGLFTDNGYQVFLNQFNNIIDRTQVITDKLFVSNEITGAPILTNEGLMSGRYAWFVQIPIKITYSGFKEAPSKLIKLTLWVVRTDTSDNLTGVAIDNVIVENGNGMMTVSNG